MAPLGSRASTYVHRLLTSRGAEIHANASVATIDPDWLTLADGNRLTNDVTAVIGPLRGPELGLPAAVTDPQCSEVNADRSSISALSRRFAWRCCRTRPARRAFPASRRILLLAATLPRADRSERCSDATNSVPRRYSSDENPVS